MCYFIGGEDTICKCDQLSLMFLERFNVLQFIVLYSILTMAGPFRIFEPSVWLFMTQLVPYMRVYLLFSYFPFDI